MTAPLFDQSLSQVQGAQAKLNMGKPDRNVLDIMFSKAPDNVLVCVNIIRLFFEKKERNISFFRCTGSYFEKIEKKVGACFK